MISLRIHCGPRGGAQLCPPLLSRLSSIPSAFPLSPSLQPSAPSTLHPSTLPVPSSLLPPLLSTSRFEPWLDTSIVDTRSRHYPDTAPTPRHSDTSVNRHLTPTLGPTLRHQCQAISTVDLLGQCQWCQDKTDIRTLDTPTGAPTPLDTPTPLPYTLLRCSRAKDAQAKDAQSKRRSGQKRSGQETLRAKDAQDKSNAPSSTRASTRASKRESMGHQMLT